MENKKLFELNDDALDAVSGGTAGTSSGRDEGDWAPVSVCPSCGAGPTGGIIQKIRAMRGDPPKVVYDILFDCCGNERRVDKDKLL